MQLRMNKALKSLRIIRYIIIQHIMSAADKPSIPIVELNSIGLQ